MAAILEKVLAKEIEAKDVVSWLLKPNSEVGLVCVYIEDVLFRATDNIFFYIEENLFFDSVISYFRPPSHQIVWEFLSLK